MPRNSTKARATTRKQRGSSPTPVPEEGPNTSLRAKVCGIIGEVQRSSTGQRKLIIALRKIQESCCYEPTNTQSASASEEFDENDFNGEVTRCLLKILTVKKSEPVGDRIVKFLSLFLKHATDADNAIFREGEAAEGDEEEGLPETPSTRLTSQIISLLLPLFTAKDKIVRFRSTQIVAHIVNTLDSVDDELFHHLRLAMLKRLRDKEPSVRVQAVHGLGRLAGEGESARPDDDSDDEDTSGGVLEKLLQVLQNDPSAEVRRALLLNLPFSPSTLPYLLERARDLDPSIRRSLYSRLLPALGDFRHLSLTHREKLLRWGLRDRDEHVQKATARLFCDRWIEDCARPQELGEERKEGEAVPPSEEGLKELLERIDVTTSGNDGGIAIDAMRKFWEGRPDYRDHVQFDDAYWKNLSPEAAFIVRTFNDFCQGDDAQASLLDKLPEVTKFAYVLQQEMNSLVELVQNAAGQEDAEEDTLQQEFIVEQLLHIALTLDFSDEIGRRTMFSLMRGALSLADIPEETTKLIVDVLRMTCGTSPTAEREFCGVVLEAITDVHDTIMGDIEEQKPEDADESFHSAVSELSDDTTPRKKTPEEQAAAEAKAIREIMVNMKCLHIAQCMLQNVECNLEQNAHLVTLLNSLVVPAVRSQEAPIRERGLLCLGLCCLLDKNLAEENMSLFLHCFSKGHEALQNIAVQILGDILAVHPNFLVASRAASETEEPAENPLQKPLQKAFSKGLKSPSAAVQSTTCTALCKLMLSSPAFVAGVESVLNVDELLKILIVAYFDPETAGNFALRQALSYFIPVYCHSSQQHMSIMGRVALGVLHACFGMKEEMDVDGEEDASGSIVGLNVVVAHLVDWTDGRKLAIATRSSHPEEDAAKEASCETHVDLALQLLEKLLGTSSKDERKLYFSMLSKLSLSSNTGAASLREVEDLVGEVSSHKIAADATSRNALSKFESTLSKAVSGSARSRAVSRAPSIAPYGAADADSEENDDITEVPQQDEQIESDVLDGEDASMAQTSAAPTPAASPRKKTRTTMPFRIKEEISQVEKTEDNGQGPLAEIDQPRGNRSQPSPKKKVTEALLKENVRQSTFPVGDSGPGDESVLMDDAMSQGQPIESSKLRAQDTKSSSGDLDDAAPLAEGEDTVADLPPPSPTKRTRSRPTRAAATANATDSAAEAPRKRAPRQSLRASRRTTAAVKQEPADE